MEKGNARTSSTKSNNSDSKIKQDVTNKHLRLPRVKESISPRPESRHKPNPQRNRELFDKRPRNRAAAVCEKYRSEVDEIISEGCERHRRKKTNLNHLLNFTLAPPDHRDAGIRRTGFNRNKHPKYNKEQFLQANCQFVVRDSGNYAVYENNPDILVEWSLIEEIRLSSHEVPLCPICLYSPIAAKITRCGHIYCWPCILHYLALTDRMWQKCPICFEAVHKDELKSVSLRIQKSFNVGDEIIMCLMKREKDLLLPVPVIHEGLKHVCNYDNDDHVARFQKLLLASKRDIDSIINREKAQLEDAYAEAKDTPEACFIESALKLLEERYVSCNGTTLVSARDKQMASDLDLVSNNACQQNHLESLNSTESYDETFTVDSTEHCSDFNMLNSACKLSSSATSNMHHDLKKKEISYFYQADDGQHIYLHSINVRMLLKEYGSLENSPPLIMAKILEIDTLSMTDALRKRFRYLQHLPLTCEFQIVELNFCYLLKKSTLDLFKDAINERKDVRKNKARNERRWEKFIQQKENKKLGKYPKATYNLQSIDQFPSCHQSDFLSLSSPKDEYYSENCSASYSKAAYNLQSIEQFPSCHQSDFLPLSSPKDEYYLENCSASSSLLNDTGINYNIEGNNNLPLVDCSSHAVNFDAIPTTSFAQMLKDGPKTSTQSVKEKKRIEVESPPHLKLNVDSDDENWVPPPKYHQSFSDAIQAALESVTLQEPADNGKRSGKKKRGKKQLLFTTSMCRNK